MSNTTDGPYGDPEPGESSSTGVAVKDPHEHHWFKEPTEKVSNKYVAALVFAQLIFFIALLGPAIIGIGVKVQSIVPDGKAELYRSCRSWADLGGPCCAGPGFQFGMGCPGSD